MASPGIMGTNEIDVYLLLIAYFFAVQNLSAAVI